MHTIEQISVVHVCGLGNTSVIGELTFMSLSVQNLRC
jgi:hypothetical protein